MSKQPRANEPYTAMHTIRVSYGRVEDGLTSAVSGVAEVGGEAVGLVVPLPLGAAAVVVVGEDLVVVDVASGQQGAPARAAHGSGHVCVPQLRALVADAPQGVRHEVQRTCEPRAHAKGPTGFSNHAGLSACIYMCVFPLARGEISNLYMHAAAAAERSERAIVLCAAFGESNR